MDFTSGNALLELCKSNGATISEVMLAREIEISGISREQANARMSHTYQVMKNAVTQSLSGNVQPIGGLIGKEADLLFRHAQSGRCLSSGLPVRAEAYAMGVLEVNASMGLIAAAPTAGSSGVIPGTFLAVQEEYGFSDQEMENALWNAGAVGYLITRNATVSGAEGGCQAEVGSASAMAASALTQLMGGSPKACLDAAATALANLLGLVCDPIAGLVEAPCQKRNGMGAANALFCADLSLSGITSLIPFDEMVEAMMRVGRGIPAELRETAMSGCAATPTGCRLCQGIIG